jgi:hypothetical protein
MEVEGQLLGRGLDLLQADDIRLITREPVEELLLARADAVDVPGRDLQLKAPS